MLEFRFDTEGLKKKLKEAAAQAQAAMQRELENAVEESNAGIDRFMFVPLRFTTEIDKTSTGLEAKTTVALNLQPTAITRRRYTPRFGYRKERRQPRSGKRWQQYVSELAAQDKDTISDSLAKEVRSSI